MPLIQPFSRSGDSFSDRTGDPDEFSCAIGRIAIWFSGLEDEISKTIGFLLGVDDTTCEIVTSEASFKNKIHLLASLVRKRFPTSMPFYDGLTLDDYLKEFVARVFEAEQMRNQIMHSSWAGPFLRDQRAERRKVTAKASRGHQATSEVVDSGYLLDIADYICNMMWEVEGFRETLKDKHET